jgi:NCAIR mutase (PurE)-related protein
MAIKWVVLINFREDLMNKKQISDLLNKVKNDEISIDRAVETFEELPFTELGLATIDNHRSIRVGYPEVIYCENKTVYQVRKIMELMISKNTNVLATRASKQMYEEVKDLSDKIEYNEAGRTISCKLEEVDIPDSYIAIVSA